MDRVFWRLRVHELLHPWRSRARVRRHALVGPPALWRAKREFQIRFLMEHGLGSDDYLLDLGCGTLRGAIPVIAFLDSGHYFGADVRAVAIAEARKELDDYALAGKHPTLIAGDVSETMVDQRFDVVWAFSVLFHMTDAILAHTLTFVSAHLAEHGVFYANVILGSGESARWREFPVAPRPLSFYQQLCADHGLRALDLGELSGLGHRTGDPSQDSQHMLEIRAVASRPEGSAEPAADSSRP